MTDSKRTEIHAFSNGPLMVKGPLEVTLPDGSKEQKENVAFCRCGESTNKPYCDGRHKVVGFEG